MNKLLAIAQILRKKPVALTVSLVVTVVALWAALKGVDLEQAGEAIKQMRWGPIGVGMIVFIAGTVIRAYRWDVMMKSSGSTFAASLEAVLVSIFFNSLLPFRTGEAVRVAYFSRRANVSVMATTAGLVMDRTMDVIALAMLGAVFLSGALGQKIEGLRFPPYLLGLGAGAAVVGFLVAGLWLRKRTLRHGNHPKSALGKRIDEGLAGLESLHSAPLVAYLLFVSVVMWLVTAAPTYFVFQAFGAQITFSQAVVMLLGITFAVALPSSPGFVGTYHAGMVYGALLVGIPKEQSLPVAIISHLMGSLPFVLAGGVVLATGGRRALAKKAVEDAEHVVDEGDLPAEESSA
ncbi:MAG: flippase-like domain-containing protein [Deltaproteobacteria bacterium]|nr:flippase-like domain-containing protein [Deltaproteobacteria bacterium]